MNPSQAASREPILGYQVWSAGAAPLAEELGQHLAEGESCQSIACLNPHSYAVARRDVEFREALHGSRWLIPDGIGVVMASRWLGGGIRTRLTGWDAFTLVNTLLQQRGRGRIFLLGASAPTLQAMQARLAREYPAIEVAGTYSPPFKERFDGADNDTMVEAINASGAEVLWVAMTAPKQEKWIQSQRSRLSVKLAGAIGAVFDFYAGTIQRSSQHFQDWGLEWLPRLLREPRRVWRRTFVSAPRFVFDVLRVRFAGAAWAGLSSPQTAQAPAPRPLRVLIISQHYWPESLRINDVAPALAEQGCEVTVLTGKPNYPDGRIFRGYRALGITTQVHEGCTIVRVPLVPRGKGRAWELTVNYLSFVLSGVILGPLALRNRGFDVVFVYGTSPILQALVGLSFKLLRKVPVVTWVQDLWPESLAMTGFVTDKRLLGGVGGVVRWIYRRSDLVLVQSRAFLPPIRELARPVAVAYQPNPGERALSAPIHPATQAAAPLALAEGFKIVFAGNLGTVQALETVIEAARLTGPDSGIRWVFVGSGARLGWLQEQVRVHALSQVQLAGRFDSGAMPAILQQADALLVSLIGGPGMSLTVPSKIQAYLSVGKPILASIDGEGARLIQEAGAGLVCPAQDASALAAAALRLRDLDAATRADMGASGQAYFDAHFAPDLVAQQLIGHLRQAARATQDARAAQ